MDYKLISTLAEFDLLTLAWNVLAEESATHVPFLRQEYLRTWWLTLGGGEWKQGELAIVAGYQDGSLVGAAPIFWGCNREQQPALLFVGSIEVTDYLDLIARPQDLQSFVDGLLDFLDSPPNLPVPGWQVLDLWNFIETSPTLLALERAAQRKGWAMSVEGLQHCPFIPLPGNWETYLAGIDKKQRHEIRRKMRRLEEAEVPSRWYIVEDPATVEAEGEAFMALMADDEKKAAFLTEPMRRLFRGVIRWAFETGCLHLSFLEIDGKKAAGYLCFNYLNHIWVYNSGLNRQFMEYSPGWVLLAYLIKWSNENGIQAFDFMRGDEEYKYRFGSVDRSVKRVLIKR
jgi:CelD/BcsL family acetyltransferase involved in cellulose biosynthesis